MRKLNIALNDRKSGVTYHRLVAPLSLFPDQFNIRSFQLPQQLNGNAIDVMIFNRSFGLSKSLHDLQLLTDLHNNGVKVIMDIDDSWELPEHHTIRWRRDLNYREWQECILNNMFFADLFWVSTEEIKTKIKKLFPNKDVIVVRNALHLGEKMWNHKQPLWEKKDGKVHIGYVGGNTHYKDLDHIKPAIAKINKYHNKKIVWHQCGYDTVSEHGKRVSAQIRYIFTTNGKYYKNYVPHGGLPIDEYAHFYDGLDISIAPLHNNGFNECKSELKVLEAGQKKCAFIGEDIITYSRSQEHCDLELAHTTEQWYESIMHYVENRDELEEYKNDLHKQVKAYDLIQENNVRIKSIESLF